MVATFHLAEKAFALHLFLQSFKRLVDIIVAHNNLYDGTLSILNFSMRPCRTLSFSAVLRDTVVRKPGSYHTDCVMPTPEHASSVIESEKILRAAAEMASVDGWTEAVFQRACAEHGVLAEDNAWQFPDGAASLVPTWFEMKRASLKAALADEPLDDMRIREKVSTGVELWLNDLSAGFSANVKAFDWCTVRPLGTASLPEVIWAVADTIWTGIGDTSEGFTYYSKRATLSAVITSTLAVWRSSNGNAEEWKPFLDRRIEDVMTFEKFKAGLKVPDIPVPF